MYSSLFEILRLVLDPRIDRKKLYPLDFLLLIVFLSTLSGCTSDIPKKSKKTFFWGILFFSCLIE